MLDLTSLIWCSLNLPLVYSGALTAMRARRPPRGCEQVRLCQIHPGQLAYRDSVPLSNTQDGHVDVGSTCFQSRVRVRHSAGGIVVEMRFDVAS